jgi:hypothetical protein
MASSSAKVAWAIKERKNVGDPNPEEMACDNLRYSIGT